MAESQHAEGGDGSWEEWMGGMGAKRVAAIHWLCVALPQALPEAQGEVAARAVHYATALLQDLALSVYSGGGEVGAAGMELLGAMGGVVGEVEAGGMGRNGRG